MEVSDGCSEVYLFYLYVYLLDSLFIYFSIFCFVLHLFKGMPDCSAYGSAKLRLLVSSPAEAYVFMVCRQEVQNDSLPDLWLRFGTRGAPGSDNIDRQEVPMWYVCLPNACSGQPPVLITVFLVRKLKS